MAVWTIAAAGCRKADRGKGRNFLWRIQGTEAPNIAVVTTDVLRLSVFFSKDSLGKVYNVVVEEPPPLLNFVVMSFFLTAKLNYHGCSLALLSC